MVHAHNWNIYVTRSRLIHLKDVSPAQQATKQKNGIEAKRRIYKKGNVYVRHEILVKIS